MFYVSVCFISLASQVLLDSKEMELVGCEIEIEQIAVHNPPTIGPRAATILVDCMDSLKKHLADKRYAKTPR